MKAKCWKKLSKPPKSEGKSKPICIGDAICLYSEDRLGYVFSYLSSSSQNELAVYPDQDRVSPILPNPHAAVFQIWVQQRYKLNKKIAKIESLVEENETNIVLQNHLAQAKRAADSENSDNNAEQKRQTGKTLLYGSIIQLKHCYSGKWVHVNASQTSKTESSNFLTELRAENGKGAFFKVMPRYKVKTEGEMVQVGDQINFESIKAPGSSLHVGKFLFGLHYGYSDCLEVNASLNSSGFTLIRFSQYTDGENSGGRQRLRGGAMIRLYHLELEAYFVLEGIVKESGLYPHLRIRRQDQGNPKSMYFTTSAISFWKVEKESGILDGGAVRWGENVKLRHVVRREYLTIDEERLLTTTDDALDPATNFIFHPVVKSENEIPIDAGVRIQHNKTKLWLHGTKNYIEEGQQQPQNGKQKLTTSVPLRWTKALRVKLETVENMMYNDAFSIQPISEETVVDVNFVAGIIPLFHKLAVELAKGKEIHPKELVRVETGLSELEAFMVPNNGKPLKFRQKILRNFQLIDLVVDLLKFRLDSRSEKMEQVYSSLIRVLSAYLKGNSRKNEMYMGRHIDFFLSQIGEHSGNIGVASTVMTIELLKNNRKLVDLIDTAHLRKLCALVHERMNHLYLDLLSALCVCDGISLGKNQNLIAEELLSAQDNPFLQTDLGQNVGRRKNVVYISWDKRKTWQTLHDFTRENYGSEYYLYLKHQLLLFSDLCAGRNAGTVELLTEQLNILSWEECYLCIVDGKLGDEIRAVYCRLIYDLFINIGTNLVPRNTTKLVYVYHDIPIEKHVTKENAGMGFKPIPLPFIEPLKDWISVFLQENDSMVGSEIARNTLITEILTLVRQLTLLGYYEEFCDIKRVLDPIVGLLEGSDDLPYQVADVESAAPAIQQLVASYRRKGRYQRNTQNSAMVDVKIGACHATNLLFNLGSSVRLDRLVTEYKMIVDNKEHPLRPMLETDYNLDDEETNTKALAFLQKIFKKTNYVDENFVNVGLDLCNYEFKALVSEAMFLIHRYHSSGNDMFQSASRVQLLLTDKSREVEETISLNLRQCRLMLSDKYIDMDNYNQLDSLLEEFASFCYMEGDPNNGPHPINQQILYNHGILDDFMDIIAGNIEIEAEIEDAIYCSSFNLLRALAKGNNVVQNFLFSKMRYLIRMEKSADQLASLFVEIFTGNNSLCLKVSQQLVTEVVSILSRTRSSTFIRLLNAIVKSGNEPVKRNQSLVIRALLQHKQTIEIITDTTTTTKLQTLAVDDTASENAIDRKRYMASLVQLLALCAKGGNKGVESICQSMFTFDELLKILNVANICDGIRGPFLQFFVAVFFTAESPISSTQLDSPSHHPYLWAFLESTIERLRKTTQDIAKDPTAVAGLLKHRPTHIHKSNENAAHEMKESLHYLFDAFLPFLDVFFHYYFDTDPGCLDDDDSIVSSNDNEERANLSAQLMAEEQISSQLLHALVPFARAVHGSIVKENHRNTLRKTVLRVKDAVNPQLQLPQFLFDPSKPKEFDSRTKYQDYYQEEQRLNRKLCNFVANLKAIFGGKNNVGDQLGLPNTFHDRPYTEPGTEKALPLGTEFQQLVQAFVNNSAPNTEEKLRKVRAIITQVGTSPRKITEQNRDQYRKLGARNLQILRAILHNEIVTIPPEGSREKLIAAQENVVKDTQKVLVDMGVIEAVMNHCNSASNTVSREVFAFLATLLHGGDKHVQDRFMRFFLGSREAEFFICLKNRMIKTEEMLKERRLLKNQYNEAILKDQRYSRLFLRKRSNPDLEAQSPGRQSWWMKLLGRGQRKPKVHLGYHKSDASISAYRQDQTFAKASESSKQQKNPPGLEKKRGSVMNQTSLHRKMWQNTILKEYVQVVAAEAVLDDLEQRKSVFSDTGNLKLVFAVLAGLCDGQNTEMQDYCREQHDNLKTIGIVAETANFLALLSGSVNSNCMEFLIQLVDTLIEMIQGNEANQIVVFERKSIDYVNQMLRNESMTGCSVEQIYRLKRSIGILLTDMVEENSVSGHTKTIMASVSKTTINKVMLDAFTDLQVDSEAEKECKELILSVAFLYHHLLCRAFDLDPTIEQDDFVCSDAFNFFQDHTMAVEIMKEDTLQRVYFTVEDKEVLRESVKERLKWGVDRSSPSGKHRDFMAWAKEVCQDIRYQRKIQSNPICRTLVSNWAILNSTVLLLTYVLNVVVLLGWIAPEKFTGMDHRNMTSPPFKVDTSDSVRYMTRVLGSIHVLLCFMLMTSFMLAERPTLPDWCKNSYRSVKNRIWRHGSHHHAARTGLEDVKTMNLSVNLLSWGSLYYVMLFVFSILGTTVSAACFAFHTLHIATQNQLLRRVILAVTLNGRSMLWVCFLGVIFFYIYALIGFLFLRNIYAGNDLPCSTLFECFIATMRNGLMFGMADHFDIPNDSEIKIDSLLSNATSSEDTERHNFTYFAFKMLYDISFFALITTIGLNIIFGITIDTFSQLRENKAQIEADMRSNCFICNRDSFAFEHHGQGFEHHVKNEHNMWAYLFFFIHLSDTPVNDLTSLELHVHRQIETESLDFFPLGRALSLSQWEAGTEDERLDDIQRKINMIMELLSDEVKEKLQVEVKTADNEKRREEEKKSLFWKKKKEEPSVSTAASAPVRLLPPTRRHHATYGVFKYRISSASFS